VTTDPREIVEYPDPDEAARDGIEEEDNKIPAWFSASFAFSIVIAAVYIPYYMFSGWSAAGQWAAQVEQAEVRYADARQVVPSSNPYRGNAAAIAAGEQVYATTCVACHKPDGSGLVGPSLIDPYWKYGNSDEVLYETVDKGRPLGMPPWGAQLGSEKIWQVLAYMETLPKSAAAGIGAPEGWTPGN